MSIKNLRAYFNAIIKQDPFLEQLLVWNAPAEDISIRMHLDAFHGAPRGCSTNEFRKLLASGVIRQKGPYYILPFDWFILTEIVYKSLPPTHDNVHVFHALNYFRFSYIIALLRFTERRLYGVDIPLNAPAVSWTPTEGIALQTPFRNSMLARITGNDHFTSDIDITLLNRPAQGLAMLTRFHSLFFRKTLSQAFDINVYAVNFCIARTIVRAPRSWDVYAKGTVILPNRQTMDGFELSRLRMNSCMLSKRLQLSKQHERQLSPWVSSPDRLTAGKVHYISMHRLPTYTVQLAHIFKYLEKKRKEGGLSPDQLRLRISQATLVSVDQYFTVSAFKHVVACMIERRPLVLQPYEYYESVFENIGFIMEIFCLHDPCIGLFGLVKKTIKYMVRVYDALRAVGYKDADAQYAQLERFDKLRKKGASLDVEPIHRFFEGKTQRAGQFKRYIVHRCAGIVREITDRWIQDYLRLRNGRAVVKIQ